MVYTAVLETVPFGVVGSNPIESTKIMDMTTEEIISLIEKMGFKITVDCNPSEEKIQRIEERLKIIKRYEKRIQKMSCIRQ